MRYLYSFLLYLILPFILLRLWWKARRLPAYRHRWWERLGFIKPITEPFSIWIHGVSVGETIAAIPLMQELHQRFPQYAIVMTTMTPTGSELASKQIMDKIYHVYIPYDLPDSVARFIHRIRPKLAIIMETELWPNILHQLAKNNIPVMLANARLSARSAKGYRYISGLTHTLLNHIHFIAAQTAEDARRFISLGANAENVQVTGSIKFDTQIPHDMVLQGKLLRASWDIDRPVWIAASTHAGEDEKILNAFATVRKKLPTTLLILVPRHPERFHSVETLCIQKGYNVIKRREGLPCLIDTDIFLGDSLGELFLYYAASDVAFVGGSLVAVGGHNLLEPAALGLPIISGHHLFNFTEISRLLYEADALIIVHKEQELAQAVIHLLQDNMLRKKMGEHGAKVVEKNRGALQKHLQWIDEHLQ